MKIPLYCTLIVAMSFSLFFPAESPGKNLIRNGDFEHGSTGWRGDENIVPETPDNANNICKIMVDESEHLTFYQTFRPAGIEKIKIRFRVKKSADHRCSDCYVGIKNDDSTQASMRRLSIHNNDWNDVEYVWSLDPDTTRITIFFEVWNGQQGSMSFDDVEVVEYINPSQNIPANNENEKNEDGYRIFTDLSGNEIHAKIVACDDLSAKIRVERSDGQRFLVSPAAFSAEDQQYINAWITAHHFSTGKDLQVSFNTTSESVDEKCTLKKPGFKGDYVQFEITLNNRSKQPIKDLYYEYCYYTKDSNFEFLTWDFNRGKVIDLIRAGAAATFKTKRVKIGNEIQLVNQYDSRGRADGQRKWVTSKKELAGIWVRLYGPVLDGENVYRDVCYPPDLQKKANWNAK